MRKRKPIFIIALLIALLGISLPFIAAAESELPIEDFIVSVAIQDLLGNPVTDSAILGNEYKIFITFEEGWNETMDQIPHTDGVVIYYLPMEFLAPEPKSNVAIHSTSPPNYPVIAHYNIYEDGRVEITFLNLDKDGNELPDGESFIEHYCNAMFTIEITAQFVGSAEDIEIEFGSHVIKNISLLPPEPPVVVPELHVEKTRSEYDAASRTIDYELTISAYNGPVSNIILRDGWVSSRPLSLELAEGALGQIIVNVPGEAPLIINNIPWDNGESFFLIDFEDLFPGLILNPGESITLTYSFSTDALIDAWGDPATGGRNHNFNISNQAFVWGLDEDENELTGSGFSTLNIQNSFIGKSGYKFDSGMISWFCGVGDGITPLNGAIITDTLGPGMFNAMDYFNVQFFDKADNRIGDEYFPTEETSFTFEVPLDGLFHTEIYYARFNVYAYVDFSSPDGTYTNRLDIDLLDGESAYTDATLDFGIPAHEGTSVTKSHVIDDEYIYWTIDFYIPAEYYGEAIVLQDYLYAYYVDESGETHLVYVYNSVEQEEVEVSVRRAHNPLEDVEEFEWEIVDYRDFYLGQFYRKDFWRLFFVGEDYPIYGPSPFEDDTILTVRFRTPLSAQLLRGQWWEDGEYLGMTTIGDVLRQNPVNGVFGEVRNLAQGILFLNPLLRDTYQVLDMYEDDVIWPIHKYASQSGNDTYLFTVVIDSGMFRPGLPALFRDEFDSRLEYVPFSFVVEHNGNRFYPRSAIGGDALLDWHLITNNDATSTMEVDLSSLYMRPTSEQPLEDDPTGWYAPAEWYASTEGVYIVRYELRVADPEIDVQTYTNIATIYSTTRGQEFSAKYEIKHGSKPLDKTWIFAETGATAEVEIIINPAGLTFSSYGYYEVRDTMSDTLSLFLGSLRAYEQVSGNWELRELTEVANPADAHWTFAIISDSEFALVLPDSIPIRLTYNVLVKGAIGDTVEISNQVEIVGKAYDFVNNFFDISEYDGGAFGDEIPVTLYKYDGENPEAHLPGARFALYTGANIAGYQPAGLPADIPRTKEIEGTTFYLIGYGITNELGIIVFDSAWLATFRTPRPYAIVEIDPPPGYVLPNDPITLFSFQDLSHLSESFDGRNIHQIADNIRIANETDWTPIEEIPLTGGGGTMWFTLGGLLIIGTVHVLLWNVNSKYKKGSFTNGSSKQILKQYRVACSSTT